MSGAFGQRAVTLYSLAARAFGWRPDEFWSATPREFWSALGTGMPPDRALPLGRDELMKLMELDNG